ncbi:MAG: DUF4192 domain-containing protein [Nakamurella sp.]
MTPPPTLELPLARETIRLSGPLALIGAVPILLGFHPARSLVMLCVHGLRQRVGPALRIDLPIPAEVPAVASFMATQASRHATTVMLLCYSPDADDFERGRAVFPHAALMHSCLDELRDSGVPVMDAVLVRAGKAWSYLHHTPRDTGRRLPADDDPGLAHLRTAHVGAGRAVMDDRDDVARAIAGPSPARADASAVVILAGFGRWDSLVANLDHRATVEAGCHLAHERLIAAIGAYLDGASDLGTAEVWADLIATLRIDLVRDAVLSWCLERIGETPVGMFVDIARWVGDDFAVPILSILALLAYRSGDGALANVALDRALGIDPAYRLAVLTQEFIAHGVHPTELDSLIIGWADHPANPTAPFWFRLDSDADNDTGKDNEAAARPRDHTGDTQ